MGPIHMPTIPENQTLMSDLCRFTPAYHGLSRKLSLGCLSSESPGLCTVLGKARRVGEQAREVPTGIARAQHFLVCWESTRKVNFISHKNHDITGRGVKEERFRGPAGVGSRNNRSETCQHAAAGCTGEGGICCAGARRSNFSISAGESSGKAERTSESQLCRLLFGPLHSEGQNRTSFLYEQI